MFSRLAVVSTVVLMEIYRETSDTWKAKFHQTRNIYLIYLLICFEGGHFLNSY